MGRARFARLACLSVANLPPCPTTTGQLLSGSDAPPAMVRSPRSRASRRLVPLSLNTHRAPFLTPLDALALAFSASLALPPLCVFLLDLAGIPLRATTLGAAMLGGLVLIALAASRPHRPSRTSTRSRHLVPAIASVLAGLAAFGVAVALAWPTLLSPSISVDVVHNYLQVDYILRRGGLPDGFDGIERLGEMVAYPFGANVLVVALSWASGVAPLRLMHPVAAALLGAIAFFGCAVATELARRPRPGWLPGLLVPALLLSVPSYTFGVFTRDYFLSQMLAMAALMALWYWLVRYLRAPRPFWLLPTTLLGSTVLFSYPTLLPLFAIPLAVAPRLAPSRHAWLPHLRDLVLVGFPLAALAFLYLDERRREIGQQIFWHAGAAISPSLEVLPPPFLLLAAAGLLVTAVSPRQRPTIVPVWLTLLAMLGLRFAAGIPAYHSDKLIYLLAPQLTVLAAVALLVSLPRLAARLVRSSPASRAVPRLSSVLGLTATVGAFGLAAAVWTRDPSISAPVNGPAAPLTPDSLALAAWFRASLPGQEPLYYRQGPAVGPYWFDLALLEGRRDRFRWSRVLTTPEQLWRWYLDPDGPTHLVALAPVEAVLGGAVGTLHRVGELSVARRGQDPSARRLADQLVLWNARVEPEAHVPGEPVRLTLGATATAPSVHPHMLVARLSDWHGRPVAEASRPAVPPNMSPMTPFVHELELVAPADTPPGLHRLEVLLFRLPDWSTAPLLPLDSPEPRPLVVGSVLLAPPADDGVDRPVSVRFGGQIELVGHRGLAVRPDAISLDLVWRALAPVDRDYTVFVHLLDSAGRLVAQHDGPAWDGGYPTSAWLPNRPLSDRRLLRLPADLPAGQYRLVVGLYRLDTLARLSAASTGAAPGGDSAVIATLSLPIR